MRTETRDRVPGRRGHTTRRRTARPPREVGGRRIKENSNRRKEVAEHVPPEQNYGAFTARAPARWDRPGNWFRKAPHRPRGGR